MYAYVRNIDTKAVSKVTEAMAGFYLGTGEFEIATAKEYEEQQEKCVETDEDKPEVENSEVNQNKKNSKNKE